MARLLALSLLVPLAACGPGESPSPFPPEASGETAPDTLAPEAGAASIDALPPTKTGTIRVEGSEQQTTLTLVRDDNFPLPFATYAPEGMTYESAASGEGSAARFTMGPEGNPAMLSVFVPSNDPGDLAAWAQEAAEMMGEPSQLDAFPQWVSAAYSFGGADVMGSVRAGRHNGQAFYVLETIPLDMGDGFSPRAAAVLSEWRWLDDGSGLGK